MIEAHLYFRDVCFKVMRLDATYPPKTIRECSVEPVQVESWADMSPIDEKQKLNIWIYILVNRIGQFAFKYEFRGAQSDVNFAKPIGRIWDVGFNEEPNENVNLDKLTAKLRGNLKTKELLIAYYNS